MPFVARQVDEIVLLVSSLEAEVMQDQQAPQELQRILRP